MSGPSAPGLLRTYAAASTALLVGEPGRHDPAVLEYHAAKERVIGGHEGLVDRQRLARALRSAANRSGVDCRWDAVVRLSHSHGLWHGRLRSGATVAAPQMIDARGRRGAARRGPLLLALGQEFEVPRSAPRRSARPPRAPQGLARVP